ncbi:MAG: hypothetical protein HOU81_12935 [Hamadaea sp.]|uniref:hypothetical protein n=1 Tax=Hamadaea sp. TaxID=2024425 RepID=UPI001831C110|nr:hypothetical protein [Hamadaea sp.]NUR71720.1 hypothetical protein [Hamadaea sp.]NUT19034.1 hypothetical protein [Hamadaea sp.]
MTALRTGLVLAVLLGLADVAQPFSGGDFPPMGVAIAGAALGLITIGSAVYAWRGNRIATVAVVVTRLLSALSAVPAFFVPDVPAAARIAAAAICALTVAAVALVSPGLRKPLPA